MHKVLGQIRWMIVERLFPGLTSFPFTMLEAALLLVVVLLVWLWPAHAQTVCRRIAGWFQPIFARPNLSLAVIVVGVMVMHLGIALVRPPREPLVTDEFSYLLAADTFTHGRLANPPHPLRIFFETPHVNQTPTYASMYPPGQGLILAVGTLLFGHPIAGQWLASAVLTGLIYWALRGYLPSSWALLGAGLCAMRIATFSCWANSYYMGTPSAIGGALVIGALPRITRRRSAASAVALGAGFVILANTRPFEGFLLSIGAFIFLSKEILRSKGEGWRMFRRISLPLLLTVIPGAIGTAYYNFRVNGNPFLFGYQINMARHGLAVFPWQSTHAEVVLPQAILRAFYDSQHAVFLNALTPHGFFLKLIDGFGKFWRFYIGPVMSLAAVGLVFTLRDRRMTAPWFAVASLVPAVLLNAFNAPHYVAPGTAAFYVLLVQSLRHLRCVRSWRFGFQTAAVIPVVAAVMFSFRLAAEPLRTEWFKEEPSPSWCMCYRRNTDRAVVKRQLSAQPGKHLAIVRYESSHNSYVGWVYNEADIDSARIVWAHDLGKEKNLDLLRNYHDRTVWLIEVNSESAKSVAVSRSEE